MSLVGKLVCWWRGHKPHVIATDHVYDRREDSLMIKRYIHTICRRCGGNYRREPGVCALVKKDNPLLTPL